MAQHTVRVFLRGGAHFDLTGEEVSAASTGGELTRLTWQGLTGPSPLFIKLEDVSAVIHLREG
jgi:hypothetical protein